MAHAENILSVALLALVVVVFAGIVHQLAPRTALIIPVFAVFAVGLWVTYDAILLNRYEAKMRCAEVHVGKIESDDISDSADSTEISDLANTSDQVNAPDPPSSITKQSDNEFDIDIYTEARSLEEIHRHMASPGDTRICNRMKYMGMQPQLSQNIRSEWNKYSMQPFLEEELAEHANREWWNSDYLEEQF